VLQIDFRHKKGVVLYEKEVKPEWEIELYNVKMDKKRRKRDFTKTYHFFSSLIIFDGFHQLQKFQYFIYILKN